MNGNESGVYEIVHQKHRSLTKSINTCSLQELCSVPYHTSIYLEMPAQCSEFIYQDAPGYDENRNGDKLMNCKI